jgi:hypothetical protein
MNAAVFMLPRSLLDRSGDLCGIFTDAAKWLRQLE